MEHTKTTGTGLPDPNVTPTVGIADAARILGVGRDHAYRQAGLYVASGGAEGIPAIRIGRTFRIPTASLLDMLALPPARSTSAQ